jgi:hypothetical protein
MTMKTLYLDLFSGISGDMFAGALIDLGVDAHKLERELKKLKLGGYHLHVTRRQKSGIAGVKLDVHLTDDHDHGHPHEHGHHHHHHHSENRTFTEIKKAHFAAKHILSAWVKEKSIGRLPAHRRSGGKNPRPAAGTSSFPRGRRGGFHRGHRRRACIALEMLGKPRVLAAAGGRRHGLDSTARTDGFPFPPPRPWPSSARAASASRNATEPHELVTPTGAALLAEFAESFEPDAQSRRRTKSASDSAPATTKPGPMSCAAILGSTSPTRGPKSKAGTTGPAQQDWETDTGCGAGNQSFDDHEPGNSRSFCGNGAGGRARWMSFSHPGSDEEKPARRACSPVLCAETGRG